MLTSSLSHSQLWMGTHPSCPSTLLKDGKDLKEHIKAHPELLGDKVVKKFGEDLPFLFKVRSLSLPFMCSL
jgi:mannose-6-phosphate isomerase